MKKKRYSSSTVLTAVTCVGVGATAVTAIYDTRRACDSNRRNDVKCYIPTAAVGTITIVSAIMGAKMSKKELASLASALGTTGTLFNEYKKKTKEIVGEEKFMEIAKKVADEKIHKCPYAEIATVPELCTDFFTMRYYDWYDPTTDLLFHDEFTDKWFYSNPIAVKNAELYLARCYSRFDGMYEDSSVETYYKLLGLRCPDGFESFGWFDSMLDAGIEFINFDYTPGKTEDGEEYISITYATPYCVSNDPYL